MRLLLFTGFLGSGKTTLVLAVAKRAAASGLRICIIVNEVGEVGIDGEVLRVGDLEVREITAGCICCEIGVSLVMTLRELEEHLRPDLVIVEASGIATPAGVLETLRAYPTRSVESIETVTVVDPTRFEALHEVLTPLIEAQIAGADRVVITKCDEAIPEALAETQRVVGELAPVAPVHVVDAARVETLAPLIAALLDEVRGQEVRA